MFSNNLNGAYEYESERRNDERRAAAESQRVHDLLGGRRKRGLPAPMLVVGILAVLVAFLRAF